MAEKIIYDISFVGLEDARLGLQDITKKQIKQAEAVKQAKAEIKEYEKTLKELNDATTEGAALTQEDVQVRQELTDKIQEGKESLAEESDILKEVNSERRNAVNEIQTLDDAINSNTGSNQQLKAELKLLTAEYNVLSEEEAKNTDAGKELGTQILKITDNLKENESAIGDNRRNVGNYSGALEGALGKINIMGVNLGQMTAKMKAGVASGKSMASTMSATAKETTAQSTATKGATVASGGLTKALRFVKVALVATGIGAIVLLLGGLISAFAGTQRGADAFKRAIEPVKAVMASLLGVLEKVSFMLVDKLKAGFEDIKKLKLSDVFKNVGDSIKTNVMNRLESFGVMAKAIVKIFSKDWKEGLKDLGDGAVQLTTGITDASDKVAKIVDTVVDGAKEVVDVVTEAAKQGAILANMEIALEKARIKSTVTLSQINKEMKEQRLLSSDMTASDNERIAALGKAIELSKQKSVEEKKLVQQELEIAQLKATFNDTDREAKLDIEKLKARLLDLDAAALSEAKMMNTMLTGIQLKQQKAEEKRIENIENLISSEKELAEAKLQTKLASLGLDKEDLTDSELKAKEVLTVNHLATIEKIEIDSAKRIADAKFKIINESIKNEVDAGRLAQLKLDENYYNDLASKDYTTKEKTKLDKEYALASIYNSQAIVEEGLIVMQDALDDINERESLGEIFPDELKDKLITNLQQGSTSMAQFSASIKEITKGDDDAEGGGFNMDKFLGIDPNSETPMADKFTAVAEKVQAGLAVVSDVIKVQTAARIAKVNAEEKKGLITEEQAEKKRTQIKKEQGNKQKAIAISTATIQLASGIVGAWSTAITQLGVVAGPPVAIANIAALGFAYAAQVATISQQKFAEGGHVQGAGTGTSDSIDAKLSNGEFVQTKKATDYYGVDYMKALNNMQLPKQHFAVGGLVQSPSSINNVSSSVSRGNQNIADSIDNQQIEVINVESNFTNKQKQVQNVETATTY